jgi:WD40 repeat protein
VLRGHATNVSSLAFSKDGGRLVTGGDDSTLRIWNLGTGTDQTPSVFDAGESVFSLTLSSDERWLVMRGPRHAIMWDLRAADPAGSRRVLPDADRGVLVSTDARWLVTYGNDETLALMEQLNSVRGPDSRQRAPLQRALQAVEPVAAIFDLMAHDVVASRRVLDRAAEPKSFSPDARWLVTDGRGGSPLLWPVTGPSTSPIVLSAHKEPVYSTSFSVDAHWLLTGGYDDTAQLWDLTAKDIAASSRLLFRHQSAVDATLSRDSRWIATSSIDGAYLWENQSNGSPFQPIALPVAARDEVGGFTPDSRWLITTNYETKKVAIWRLDRESLMRLACRTAGRNLSAPEWAQYFPAQARVTTCPEFP